MGRAFHGKWLCRGGATRRGEGYFTPGASCLVVTCILCWILIIIPRVLRSNRVNIVKSGSVVVWQRRGFGILGQDHFRTVVDSAISLNLQEKSPTLSIFCGILIWNRKSLWKKLLIWLKCIRTILLFISRRIQKPKLPATFSHFLCWIVCTHSIFIICFLNSV